MSKALEARRAAVIERNRVLESVPGSGFHDNDKFCGRYRAPQSQHLNAPNAHVQEYKQLPRISEHVVPFFDDRQVICVGDDAARTLATLKAWCEKHTPKTTEEQAVFSGSGWKLLVEVPKLKLTEREGVPTLTMWRDTWNDFAWALQEMGVGMTGQQVDASKQS